LGPSPGTRSITRVRAEVDETDIGRIMAGQRVEVTADAFPDRKFGGTVYRVSSRLGAKEVQTGRPADHADTKVLQVLLGPAGGCLFPGLPLRREK